VQNYDYQNICLPKLVQLVTGSYWTRFQK
jgi:hypothetical protein